MIPCQRALFDIPGDVAYLNCAYMSPLSRLVAEAGRAAIDRKVRPWTVTARDFFTMPDETRRLAAELFGARPADIAIMPSVSYAIATAARNFSFAKGDEILLIKDEFPSDVYGWRRLAAEQSLTIRTVDWPAGQSDWTDAVIDVIGARTRLVSLPHIHWTNGTKFDLVRIAGAARAAGAAIFLDLTQSLGAMPIDLMAIDPDFAVAANYKWLMGPYGIAFAYAAPRRQEGRPLEEGWIVRQGAQDFARLVDYQDGYMPGAVRFDMGERSQFQLLAMANAGMEQILGWGVENIAQTLAASNASLAAALAALGLILPPAEDRGPHFLGARFPMGVPQGLAETLGARNVFVSLRGDSLRVTPHLYNTPDDAERLLAALRACL